MLSPTAQSLRYLRDDGYTAAIVEQTIPHTWIKRDLWGADILALKAGCPPLAIQCTSGSHHATRRAKLIEQGFIELWTSAGARLEVWSWAPRGARGHRKVWQLRREAL